MVLECLYVILSDTVIHTFLPSQSPDEYFKCGKMPIYPNNNLIFLTEVRSVLAFAERESF